MDKKKIGILTYHRAINYGAFLQAFALKKSVESLNFQVEMIDYWPTQRKHSYSIFNRYYFNRIHLIAKVKYLISYIFRYKVAKSRLLKMNTLIYKYFNLSSNIRFIDTTEFNSLSNYDCIIYGSDQIWRKFNMQNYSGYDLAYWGSYINPGVKKITYAPSMGIIDIDTKDMDVLKLCLNHFDYLSVRENNLYLEMSKLTNKKVHIVLDPVFLISKKEWEDLCEDNCYGEYILIYNLTLDPILYKLADDLSKIYKCKIIEITGSVLAGKYRRSVLQDLDSFEFITLIKNAKYIITSSFHGTAFSLIFQKQFYSLGMGNNSDRVLTLLSTFNLQSRLLSNIDDIDLYANPIDYQGVTSIMESEIEKSRNYLLTSLYNCVNY